MLEKMRVTRSALAHTRKAQLHKPRPMTTTRTLTRIFLPVSDRMAPMSSSDDCSSSAPPNSACGTKEWQWVRIDKRDVTRNELQTTVHPTLEHTCSKWAGKPPSENGLESDPSSDA